MENNAETKQTIFNCKNNKIFKIALYEDKYIIVMGNYMASEQRFNSVEDAEKYIESKPYELILNMILIHMKYEKENKKQNTKEMESNTQENV